jgi:hypothetical protein
MPEKFKDTNMPADVLTVKAFIRKIGDTRRYMLARWKFIMIAMIIGGTIGLVYAFLRKTVYTAECTFVLEEGNKGGGSLSQYSALASMAGIDVGGGGSGLFQGDNITQLYKSRLMLEKTLLTPVVIAGKNELLIDKYIKINGLDKAWKDNQKFRSINFNIGRQRFTTTHDSIIGLIVNDINANYLSVEKPDKKLSMISVKVKATDPIFAQAFTQNIVANVNAFYIQTKTKTAVQNVLLLQHQADSVHRVLNLYIGSAAEASDATPNPDPNMLQVLRAPSQKRQVEVQAASGIYAEVVRNLEISRAALQKETPLIQVIDQPVLPLQNDRVGKLKSIITGALIAFLTSVIWLFTKKIYDGIMY